MKGLTLYLNVLAPARKLATDEQLGRYLRLALDAAENETIPTIDGELDRALFEGFAECVKTGLDCVNAKRNGVNSRWNKMKPNENFDTTVSCYTQTQKVVVDDNNSKKYYKYDTKHSDSINYMIDSNLGGLTLSTVRNTIIKEIEKDGWEPKEANNIYEEIIRGISR